MTNTAAVPNVELGDVPLASTLDEATLRRVFADAPADIGVPRDVRSLYAARLRNLGGPHRLAWIAGWLGVLVAGAVVAFAGAGNVGIGIIVAAVFAALGVTGYQWTKAEDDFFDRYAAARGLVHRDDSAIDAAIPLLRAGDEREWPRVLSGTIAGHAARLGHYTYTDVTHDSEGNREEEDHDFTVLHFTLPQAVANRFAGVECSPRRFGMGSRWDRFTDDREVQLESVEFHGRYSLRVLDSQDDIALYELFSTTFIHRLATELDICWQQRGDDLLFWRDGHEGEAADLDRFCLEAWHVLHRYLEEWR